MAGVKGRSGGARPGAGRPRKKVSAEDSGQPKQEPVPQGDVDMLTMLQNVALGRTEATALQVRAAIAAVQYTHAKVGEGGKKEAKQQAAEKVAGRFAQSAPPRLVASGGKKV